MYSDRKNGNKIVTEKSGSEESVGNCPRQRTASRQGEKSKQVRKLSFTKSLQEVTMAALIFQATFCGQLPLTN